MGCNASSGEYGTIEPRKSKVSSSSAGTLSPIETCKSKTRLGRIQECYDIRERLGTGCFAEVRACTVKGSDFPRLAVKVLNAPTEREQKKARRELEVWRKLGTHENIVPLVEDFLEGNIFYFIMPRCQFTITEKFKRRSEAHNEMLDTFHQVFLGLQHCHSLDVIHRDMKAANILVDLSDKVRIADFGLSICKYSKGTEGLVGSVPYMSPEMVNRERVGLETDIWSAGVSAYTLFYGCYPYEAASYQSTDERKCFILDAILHNRPTPAYEADNGKPHPPPSVRALIERLLKRDRQARPDAFLCSKLCLSAKFGHAFDLESRSDFAFEKASVLQDDEAGSSCATACPTEDATSSGAWSSFGIHPQRRSCSEV